MTTKRHAVSCRTPRAEVHALKEKGGKGGNYPWGKMTPDCFSRRVSSNLLQRKLLKKGRGKSTSPAPPGDGEKGGGTGEVKKEESPKKKGEFSYIGL